ncbi:DUF3486 family protein [Vibrio vulnificus]|uniref:DUF3486 family protein n=1 Tax=Vibrio vulnificus TaxID=672 RepID=UPI001FAF38CD|nr:DUF3486 family protein [Vibrio vulnificus]MCJ0803016.1 DUF3486 family protein [Vibrio vulnificus]
MQVASNRKSKVDMLPDEIKEPLNELIRSGRMQQKDILAEVHKMIDEAGLGDEAKPSRTAFNRHVKRMEDTLKRLRMGREVAEVWVSKLGDAPTSDVGRLLMEFVQTMAIETSMSMMEGSDGEEGKIVSPKALGQLALVIQRIETASMTSMKREKEIRAAYAAEAADAVSDELRGLDGMSEQLEDRIRGILLGKA